MGAATQLQRAWTQRGPLALALWPLSLLYRVLMALRRGLYRAGIFSSQRMPVPVVVVGNVVAGGSGKTPLVLALVRHLQKRGLQPVVVSRGHGRTDTTCREVLDYSSAAEVGDEPLLLRRATGAPVFVAPRRAEAARAALARYPQTRVIVCDDGLQHLALQRDVEICVFGDTGTGNGWLLPAGPLREPWPRAADLVVTGATPVPHTAGAWQVQRRLADHALRADGSRVALADLASTPLHAVAGIAQPEAFFAMLRASGLQLQSTEAFPDHYDFESWKGSSYAGPQLVCTEKDAVKLWRWLPGALAVPLQVELPPGFWQQLDRVLDAKLSLEP